MDPADTLDPAGAVTARTVVAGPSMVGEGTPGSDETDEGDVDTHENAKRKKEDDVSSRNILGSRLPLTHTLGRLRRHGFAWAL